MRLNKLFILSWVRYDIDIKGCDIWVAKADLYLISLVIYVSKDSATYRNQLFFNLNQSKGGWNPLDVAYQRALSLRYI